MSDKEKKKPSLFSSLRRSLVRPSAADETRPILPGQARPTIKGPTPRAAGLASTKNFEISLRDKSDATAKRGFRVQVPKRMLSYAVLVFIVAPLALFMYMEVHRVAASHGSAHEKVPEHHFHHDVLSLLTDEEDEKDAAALANDTVVESAVDAGNVTDTGDEVNMNSTLVKEAVEVKDAIESNATDIIDANLSNQTETDAEQPVVEAAQEEKADIQSGEKRI